VGEGRNGSVGGFGSAGTGILFGITIGFGFYRNKLINAIQSPFIN